MKIGNVIVDNPVILAPMAGVSDMPFRILCKRQGCGMVYSEMISAKGYHYKSENTKRLMEFSPEEQPIAVQIFGSEPDIMAEIARFIESSGAAFVDINMGCPAPKITKNGDGSALMQNLSLAEKIISLVVKAVKIPVTVKFRKGWDDAHVNGIMLAKIAEQCGAAAIAVHGRTREQFYSGQADWEFIRQVKQSVKIPVIGNGDIVGPQSAKKMLEETGCDGVMIGRAARGNPWIFSRTVRFLQTGEFMPEPTAQEKIEMALVHLQMLAEIKPEEVAVKEMRGHLGSYFKGLPRGSALRNSMMALQTKRDVEMTLRQYLMQI